MKFVKIPNEVYGKDNFDKLKIDNEKIPVHLKSIKIEDKTIYALDFEKLTRLIKKERKTLPVMLGKAKITPEGIIDYGKRVKHTTIIDTFVDEKTKKEKRWIDAKFNERRKILFRILETLTTMEMSKSINFFYNIKYDFGVIVSLMKEEEGEELYLTNKVKIGKYEITVIGDKMFTISKPMGKNRNRNFRFFDLANFTKCSLDKATKAWLGEEGGKTEGFDTGKVFNDESLLREVYEEAKEYCLNDVIITAKLALKVKRHFESMQIPFSNPISTASLFKSFYGHNFERPKEIEGQYRDRFIKYPSFNGFYLVDKVVSRKSLEPTISNNENMQELAWRGYFGGLFEMYKRGYFPNVVGFDYDSMYPSIMVDLPDYRDYITEKINNKEFEKYEWAVIKAKVWIKDEATICPFAVRAKIEGKEKIIRPVLKGEEVVMSKQMYDWVTKEYPYLDKLKVTGGYYLKPKKQKKFNKPFDFMKNLFEERVKLKTKMKKGEISKDDKREYVIKEILNAGYGVTAETVDKTVWEKGDLGNLTFLGNQVKAGKFLRPFYAFHITEHARLKIYKDIFDAEADTKVIGVATDCIFFEADMKDYIVKNTSFTPEKKLGTLSLEKEGEMLVIGNGVYQFRDKEGNVHKTTRGFSESNFPNLFEEGHELKNIPVVSQKPLTWREIAFSYTNSKERFTQDDINKFEDEEKNCNINMDISREWEGEFENVGDMFTRVINSRPLVSDKFKEVL
ncbi:MAG: hypothetical protein ACOC56_05135 [Atribacterota bacterium]